jgi:hypothetical protein
MRTNIPKSPHRKRQQSITEIHSKFASTQQDASSGQEGYMGLRKSD